MEIPTGKEIDILLAQLQERYGACHKMRDRSTQFSLWILGFGLGMAWLLITGPALSIQQRTVVCLFLLSVGFVSFLFIHAIERGFNNNREIVIRLENSLKFYEAGSYGSEHSILPAEFLDKKAKWSGHFRTLYYLMGLVFVLLIILTIINPCESKPVTGRTSEPTGTQQQASVEE